MATREFKGIDDWISRPNREALCAAVNDEAIAIERILLPDEAVTSSVAARHIVHRWKPTSPLRRAEIHP